MSLGAALLAACAPDASEDLADGRIEVFVSTLGPILVTSSPVAAEDGEVHGTVRVFVDGDDPPAGTVVTLNGTTLPLEQPDDTRYYRVTGSGLAPVAPGGLLTVTATTAETSASFSFACPPAVSVVAAPDPIVRGGRVDVGWTGEVFHNPVTSIAPRPRLTFCSHQSGASGLPNACGARTELVAPADGVTVTAPALSGDLGFLVELQVPGRLVQTRLAEQRFHQGLCELRQRVAFAATGP